MFVRRAQARGTLIDRPDFGRHFGIPTGRNSPGTPVQHSAIKQPYANSADFASVGTSGLYSISGLCGVNCITGIKTQRPVAVSLLSMGS
jgi:hypothetical protein